MRDFKGQDLPKPLLSGYKDNLDHLYSDYRVLYFVIIAFI